MHLKNTGKQITNLKKTNLKILIKLSDGSKIKTTFDNVKKYDLKVGKILSNRQYNLLNNEFLLEKCKDYLINIASKHQYSEEEIYRKLKIRNISKTQIEVLMNFVKDSNLVDDKKFIDDYVRVNTRKNYSINKIKARLIQKGISSNYINKIKENKKNEYLKACNLIDKKIKLLSNDSYEFQKIKAYQILKKELFSESIIDDVVKNKIEYDSKLEMKNLRKQYSIAYSKYRYKYLGDLLYKKVIEYLLRKGYSFNDIKLIEREYSNEISE